MVWIAATAVPCRMLSTRLGRFGSLTWCLHNFLSSKSLVSSVTKQIFSYCNDDIFSVREFWKPYQTQQFQQRFCQTQSKHSSISKGKIHTSKWSMQWDSSHSGGSSSANQYPDKEFCSESPRPTHETHIFICQFTTLEPKWNHTRYSLSHSLRSVE